MRILVAPDKFKGSLGAAEVAANIATGFREALADAEIALLPIADGGEGTADVICSAAGGEWHSCQVHDANSDIVSARYGTIDGGKTAVMEMSQAAGLWRVPPERRRDPERASSFGVGEMLLDAMHRGARKIIVGLGGSATNDGGFGMARALGFRFLDRNGTELVGPVSDLLSLARIEAPEALRLPQIIAAADVRIPLLGERGATRVFGLQKGATPTQLDVLEQALRRLTEMVRSDLKTDFSSIAGAGAAGGLGFGLMTFAAAAMRSGFNVVAECIGLEEAVCGADVIITGEGRLDAQSFEGKAPGSLAQLARRHGKRVYAIVGCVEGEQRAAQMFDAVMVLSDASTTVGNAASTGGALRTRARELAQRQL